MHTQLNGLSNCSRYLSGVACAIALLLLSFQPAFGTTKPDGTLEIIDGKEQFMRTLASMPYTTSGAGPILYVVECSAFPPTQAFERDWKGQLDGVEVRRIFVAVNPTTANEAGYLARTRNLDDFYAFMNRTKVAPTITSQDKAGVTAAQSMIQPYGKVLKPLMIKNGWKKDSPVPPQFMWETSGHVYVSGYSKESFPHILTMLRSDAQTKEASASPSLPPSVEPVSTSNAPSATETTGQLSTAENKSPKPDGSATVTKSGDASIASGRTVPDVLGLRIGLGLDETRTILNSKGGVSNDGKQYQESKGTLAYSPNSEFISWINIRWREMNTGMDRNVLIYMAPVPAHEEIVSVHRVERLYASKRITFGAFEKALVEKYGPPTYTHGPTNLRWVYNKDGSLQKPRPQTQPPSECTDLRSMTSPNDVNMVLKINGLVKLGAPSLEQMVTRCGSTVLFASIVVEGSDAAHPDSLVRYYSTTLVGWDAAARAANASNAISEAASAEARGAAIKKGQQQKPEL